MRFIFDSHLDLAWNALAWKRDLSLPLSELNRTDTKWEDHVARGRATISLPEMRQGGVFICLGTMMGRVPYEAESSIFSESLDFPSHQAAWAFAQSQRLYYEAMEEAGEFCRITTSEDLDDYWQRLRAAKEEDLLGLPIGTILAMEGADAIVNPDQVERWWQEGLRCTSLVHYGISQYAHGTGTDGPLTPAGREILAEFRRVGMILDVTHLSDTSFWEALEVFDGPIIATHQNCRALVPGQRQFEDRQLQALLERGGIIGVACDAWMLHPKWKRPSCDHPGTETSSVPLSSLVDHIDHLCQLAGNTDQVAIGSDLDGGFGNEQTPHELRTIADLQRLDDLLRSRGYSSEQTDAIFHGNHLRFFRTHLPVREAG